MFAYRFPQVWKLPKFSHVSNFSGHRFLLLFIENHSEPIMCEIHLQFVVFKKDIAV